MSELIQMSKTTLRQFVRESAVKERDEWITPAVWRERTGKERGALDNVLRNYPELRKKEPGIRCAINWTHYTRIYPTSKIG